MMETTRIPVTPIQKKRTLSLEKLCVPVVIREDLEFKSQDLMLKGDRADSPKQRLINDPHDMFHLNNKPARYVFLQGEAARGKTVFCLKLLLHWCRAKQSNYSASNVVLPIWETCMNNFEFLFPIRLRHVSDCHDSVVDMICHDVFGHHEDCHNAIRHVLSSHQYRCLITIDGLDEWNVSDQTRKKLKYNDIPNVQKMSNCTVLFTSRPWKLDIVSESIRDNDRVLEILGLEQDGIKTIIENVLKYFFKMDPSSKDFEDKVKEMVQKSRSTMLNSILEIPLMATASVHLWYTNADVGKSFTTFYISLLQLLIKRTLNDIDRNILESVKQLPSADLDVEISNCFRNVTFLKDFIPLLCRLGELSYDGLVAKETKLVFYTDEIKNRIGKSALEFALKVGLLSPSEAPGGYGNINVNFFHKTVQEFLSAMHIVSNKQVSIQSFLRELNKTEIIMEFGNVLSFISGLSPDLGYVISHHIVDVMNTDPDVCRYRDTFLFKVRKKVIFLCHLQLSCLRELQQTCQELPYTPKQQDYHILDVYADRNSDTDTVRLIADVLCNHNTNIVSLYMRLPTDIQHIVPDKVINTLLQHTKTLQSLYIDGNKNRTLHIINTVKSLKTLVLFNLSITPSLLNDIQTSLHNNEHIQRLGLVYIECVDSNQDTVQSLTTSFSGLLRNLPSCKHLSRLSISYMLSREDREMLVNVLPHLSQLKLIWYYGSAIHGFVDDGEYDYSIIHMVSQWTQLHQLVISFISLGDRLLELPADMDRIEEFWLGEVTMSGEGWSKFITSLMNIQHQFDVYLRETDITASCVDVIRSSSHFTVIHHDKGESILQFRRKISTTPQIQ